MRLHKLKIQEQYADSIVSGDKPYELRFNDRDYQKGDLIVFRVISNNDNSYVSHDIASRKYIITHVLSEFDGLYQKWVVLGIKEFTQE